MAFIEMNFASGGSEIDKYAEGTQTYGTFDVSLDFTPNIVICKTALGASEYELATVTNIDNTTAELTRITGNFYSNRSDLLSIGTNTFHHSSGRDSLNGKTLDWIAIKLKE